MLVIVSIITSRRSPPGSVATAALAVLLVATVALCVAMLASGTLAQTVEGSANVLTRQSEDLRQEVKSLLEVLRSV